LLVIAPILFGFYRKPMHEAWQQADSPSFANRLARAS
jgi:hypothetical protein